MNVIDALRGNLAVRLDDVETLGFDSLHDHPRHGYNQ